ncbi:TPA: hypothetical protein DEG21_01665 [Patescibacteria group bacterium]|nr:hypothetical protein [Candidatus Gracilibacteria bacterium]HBY74596.1 hypothetical protein [Candidatus Gracilibacteria bacterium]
MFSSNCLSTLEIAFSRYFSHFCSSSLHTKRKFSQLYFFSLLNLLNFSISTHGYMIFIFLVLHEYSNIFLDTLIIKLYFSFV